VSGQFIGYPTGWTLAVFDDADAAEAAKSELEESGIGPDDLILLAGPDATDRMSRLGTSSGLGARIGDIDKRRAATDVIRRHRGHFVNRFGAWATEEIAPWRGEMPDLPQYMRR